MASQITFSLVLVSTLALPATLPAQSSTYNQRVGADTFVSSGQPDANFGTLGAMEIAAPTSAQPRTEMVLLQFDTSAMQAAFDAEYGSGDWSVTGVTLSLFSNVATAGQQPNNPSFNRIAAGNFEFDLLSNNNWNEDAITWNTLPSILPGAGNSNTLTSLGTFFWDATGSPNSTWTLGLEASLATDIYNGGQITLLGQPTADSTVGYLANTLTSNPGYLNVTAAAVPEPSTVALLKAVACVTGCWRLFRKRG